MVAVAVARTISAAITTSQDIHGSFCSNFLLEKLFAKLLALFLYYWCNP
jgi:hypothetical protein